MIREEVWRWVSLADHAFKNLPNIIENKQSKMIKPLNNITKYQNQNNQIQNYDQSIHNINKSNQSTMRVSELNQSQYKEMNKIKDNNKYLRENINTTIKKERKPNVDML